MRVACAPQLVAPGGRTLSTTASTGHGTNTAGIVFGDGTGNAQFRGFAPDSGKFFTNYSTVSTSRWQVFSDLVNVHDVSHTTASWGNARTFFYTSISAEADDIIFDHDLAWTQSQANTDTQSSAGQAWAKNVGWRIDYQIGTPVIAKRAQAVQIYKDERFSDHAPLVIDYRVSDRWLRTPP